MAKIGSEMIPCQYCDEKHKANGMKKHVSLKHPEHAEPQQPSPYSVVKAELADFKKKYADLEAKLKEGAKTDVSAPVVADPAVILEDWMGSFTQEAWLEWGKQKGFTVDPIVPPVEPLPATAIVSDVVSASTDKPEEVVTHPRMVYVADLGLLIKVK
jgi:hypothetical protein